MRTIVLSSVFTAVAAVSAGVGALDNIEIWGADSNHVVEAVLAACPGTPGLTFLNTGSSNGEDHLLSGSQTIAPMQRFLFDSRTCNYPNGSSTKDASRAEGLAYGLEAVAMIGASETVDACNVGAADCDQGTDPGSGLAHSRTVDLIDGGTYTFSDWTDVLRIVYGGMTHDGGNNISNRDCASVVRRSVVDGWGNLFETACGGGGCEKLQHAFRLEEATDGAAVFGAFLNLPPVNLQTGSSPYCNVAQPVSAGPPIPPNYAEFQDRDPIRRPCIGTGNLPLPPATEPPNAPTEQVCGGDGTLGVVLPIGPPPVRNPQTPMPYPTEPCARGKFSFALAARRTISTFDLCPNGDRPIFINRCLSPMTASASFQCVNGRNNLPIWKKTATAVDGRVYNLHTRKADGTYQTVRRPGATAGAVVEAELVGSFYRLHTTRTALPAPSTAGVCRESGAGSQIGCLVRANPCSLGLVSSTGSGSLGTSVLKIDRLEPTRACALHTLDHAAPPYPLSRPLWLNTMAGYENVTGQERALAQCFATRALVEPIVAANGLMPLGQDAVCVDFDETRCGQPLAPQSACVGNPF